MKMDKMIHRSGMPLMQTIASKRELNTHGRYQHDVVDPWKYISAWG